MESCWQNGQRPEYLKTKENEEKTMALRTIRIMGDEVLTKTCREVTKVTPRISNLIDDMLETMYDACGVGLAAPQVGVLRRIVVIDVGEGPIVMINPVMFKSSRKSGSGNTPELCKSKSF